MLSCTSPWRNICPFQGIFGTVISPTVDRTVSKIAGKGQISLQGGGGARQHLWRHSVAIGVTLPYATASWRCALTTKTTLNSDYLFKIKAWEKNYQSLHSGRDKRIPSSCPWFATSTTRQASSWIANHRHSDGIPLSLPECSDRFY